MNKTLKIIGGGYKQYDEITFLRGFSILTIVLMHYLQNPSLPGIINKVLSVGGTGVHIFFFCSGFGLYQSYMKKRVGYWEFLKKRFLKIYIPYIVVVAVSALIPYMYSGNRLRAFLSHAFLYKMFIPEYEDSLGVQFWYISTLFQFYFVFIPLAKLKEKSNSKKFFAGAVLISAAWWIFTSYVGIAEMRVWGSFFLQYLWEFALGMLLAEYLWKGGTIEVKRCTLVFGGFVGLAIAGMGKVLGGTLTTFNDPFAFFGYGALALWLYLVVPPVLKKIVNFTSLISYELYLVHILVITVLHQFGVSYIFAAVTGLALSYVIAFFIYAMRGYSRKALEFKSFV